ncbi:MAG TPA: hypothetical protein VMF30_12245 [Pirellulales bacterium]|nr:hypothetical protein [Pirellulales bacterium]
MRTLLLLGAAAIGLAAIGVIKFQTTGDEVHISIDENKAKHVAEEVVEESQQVVGEAEQSLQQNDRGPGRDREASRDREMQ